jgi:hypothetical protein
VYRYKSSETLYDSPHTHKAFTTMNKYSPFKAALDAAVVELTSTQAQQYYKTNATEALTATLCFVVFCVTETIRLGSVFRDWVEDLAQERRPQAQGLLTGSRVAGLLPPAEGRVDKLTRDKRPRPKRSATLIDRMVSTVDEVEASSPRPTTRRVGLTSTVKELRALAKEQGHRNTSRLTKRELLGLLA